MRGLFVIILYVISGSSITAQSLAGITGKPDTSYNTNAAYRSVVKTHPAARVVAELPAGSVREIRNIVFCKRITESGQRNLLIDVFSAKKKRRSNRIAILIIHGGGWRSGNRTQHYPLAQHLAKLGYTCFTPEYRLSTEALYPAAVYDIKAAVKWVKQNAARYNVDTARVVILGFSAGGELATFVGATNGKVEFEGEGDNGFSSSVSAIIDIDGTLSFVHPESGEGDDSKKTSAATYWFGYSKKENPPLWAQASPLTHADKNTPPTLFINSSVERMHAGRNDFISILNAHNIYTEVKTFENSPHHFCLMEPWFTPTVNYVDQFLKKVMVINK